MDKLFTPLNHRSILRIEGLDSIKFLQGLITNDAKKISPDKTIYSFFLTPQGKYIADLFISQRDDYYYLDIPSEALAYLKKKMAMYRLRADVTLEDVSGDYEIVAAAGHVEWEGQQAADDSIGQTYKFCKGVFYADPRKEGMGWRAVIERSNHYQAFQAKGFSQGSPETYHHRRITHTLPEGGIDLTMEQCFPLQMNGDLLHAIDYQKGCYVGQEVTARTHHRGKQRKAVFTVTSNTATWPDFGTAITFDEKPIGSLLSHAGITALAQLEIDAYETARKAEKLLHCDAVSLQLR